MEQIGIGIGSNMGDRLGNLRRAVEEIQPLLLQQAEYSSVVESSAWGYQSSNAYFNIVIVGFTKLKVEDLLEKLLSIEKQLGRNRNEKGYSDRPIDLDILFYGNAIIENSSLIIPHPRMELREFVMYPLQEILPQWVHPKNGKTISEIMKAFNDELLLDRFRLY